MQELEKILEEINKRIDRSMLYSYQHAEGLREAKGIILKHMNDAEYPYIVKKTAEKYRKKNDGWIPVEKYGLPKDEGVYDLTIIDGLEEYVSVRWQFLSGTHLSGTQHYVDGVHYWADNYRGDPINEFLSERVIAWRPLPDPYRPEKERRMNLFDKVKCNGFYSKVRDGTYICLDSQNLKAAHMNSNAVDTECLVEEDVDRVEKTYYKHVKQNFCGVIVGFTDLIVTGYLDVIYNDAIDVGVGILPEQFFVQKNPNHVEKCAIVYYANNKKHYVPLEDIEKQ